MTLIELLVSIAIFAVLTTIIFTSLSQEKNRSAIKQAASQLQVDLQDMQNKSQSGVTAPDTSCSGGANNRIICSAPGDCPGGACVDQPPYGYGIDFNINGVSYLEFADMPGMAINLYDAGNDIGLYTRSLGPNIVIAKMSFTGTSPPSNTTTRLDPVFAGTKGDALLRVNGGYGDTATIVLKHTKLNLCYAVSIQKAGGTVTKRSLVTCP